MGENASSLVAQPYDGRAQTVARYTYAQRIQRARDLAAKHDFAAHVLGVYVHITELQSAIAAQMRDVVANEVCDFHSLCAPLLEPLLTQVSALSEIVRNHAPAAIREAIPVIEWPQLLREFWSNREAPQPETRFLSLALLQPCAELIAEKLAARTLEARRSGLAPASNCPLCGAEPGLAVLRAEGYGARRSLICSFCAHEWEYLRATCPACGETDSESLPVFTPEQFAYLRIEACDTCKQYLKAVDLTKNGLAVPVVDELAAVPLDLWTAEKGYAKLCPNLFSL
jgi:formate dehydrogenase accessory protein FdhE